MYHYFSSTEPLERNALLLSKDYWMQDDSASHCFNCSKSFTTFRRRHHCRLCGQIFCNTCAMLIPGERFKHDGDLRVCKLCLYNYGDSSDDDDEGDNDNHNDNEGDTEGDNDESRSVTNISSTSNCNVRESSLESLESEDSLQTFDENVFNTERHPKRVPSFSFESRHEFKKLNEPHVSISRNHDELTYSKKRLSKRSRNNLSKPNAPEDAKSTRSSSHKLSTYPSSGNLKHNNNFDELNNANAQSIADTEKIYRELNQLSKYHLSRFLHQTLDSFNVKRKNTWTKALINLISEIPVIDLQQTKDIRLDITDFINFKEILGSGPESSFYINGFVFTKNVAINSMRTKIRNPNIIIIKFPIEYSQSTNQFMSFEQILPQEKEFLDKLVKRIVSIKPKPDLLIAGANVSGYALELLGDAGITVLLNVKHHVITHLARLTSADIITSVEKLTFSPKLGHCGNFEIKVYPFKNLKKSFAFFNECPVNLGGTAIIRDNDAQNLKKVKSIAEFIIYCMFHLKLETHYFRDTFVSMNKQILLDDLKEKRQSILKNVGGYFWEFLVNFNKSLYSISPSVIIPMPYLLDQARIFQKHLDVLQSKYSINNLSIDDCKEIINNSNVRKDFKFDDNNLHKVAKLILQYKLKTLTGQFKSYSRQWDTFFNHQPNLLEVSTHQNICFSYSTTLSKNGNYCFFPKILQIEYYLDYNDSTLGQYVEHEITQANSPCPESCGGKFIDHYKTYTHGNAKLIVSIEKIACPIPGLQHVILMWSVCKKCGHKTPVIPMNDTTWKFSFGKFLELSFLSIPLTVSYEECGHDAQRDRVKYFGFYDMAIKVEYETIDLFELHLPLNKIQWKPDSSINLKTELYDQVIEKTNILFDSIIDRLQSAKLDTTNQDKLDFAMEKIESLISLAIENKHSTMDHINEIFKISAPTDYISMNVVLKNIQEYCIQWNEEFAEFEKNFLPELSKVSSLQFLKFFDKEAASVANAGEKTHENLQEENCLECEEKEPNDQIVTEEKIDNQQVVEMEEGKEVGDDNGAGEAKIQHDESTDNNKEYVTAKIPLKPKYVSKVSMIPKLKLNNTKVREKISQMEALIANGNPTDSIVSSRSPSIKSPTSLTADSQSPIKKDFESYHPKVSKLKTYFDHMQMKFNQQLEEQRKIERKLYESKLRSIPKIDSQQTVEIFKNVDDAFNDQELKYNEDKIKANPFTDIEENQEDCANDNDDDNSVREAAEVLNLDVNNESESKENSKEIPTDERSNFFENLESLNIQFSGEDVNKPSTNNDKDTCNEDDTSNEDNSGNSEVTNNGNNNYHKASVEEKNSLFIMFKKLLADRSELFKPIESPLSPSEHIFVESDVIIRDDEPGSVIAFALSSKDYLQKVQMMKLENLVSLNIPNPESIKITAGSKLEDELLHNQMLKTTAIHLKYQFLDNNAILSCKVFFVEQFEAFREKCGLKFDFIQSLSRCVKWDSSGGKSGSAFLKTLDDRLVIKQLSYSELDSFVKMAPSYFEYMAQALFHDLPTALGKIFGFYQIVIKNPTTGKNFKMDVIIMENLFYNRRNLKIFDLKGSMRNRHVEQTGKENEVLLDENMVELIFDSPLFMRNHNKKHLRACLWNDTLFLSKMNVMDYSLVIGIDWEKNEIVAGLIDYVRTFTWDKKLESWVKEKGLVGGIKRKPTVVTPKQYKSRFRAAMEKYVILVPDSWHINTNP
ncbi:hypothetical protein DASC09_004720 [Saccharomycopsis crataegensis]|uniref:1-phosphatidylinositol-3-phosphate 5-kinase n=1 Tax=Saccharomycopsis crataegensis TaxID=43959 RepID=A0AAV5QEH3_9ASCO|nr:hypothetical protein DASC09_004720 [Saccharomycopsis crataegensis]